MSGSTDTIAKSDKQDEAPTKCGGFSLSGAVLVSKVKNEYSWKMDRGHKVGEIPEEQVEDFLLWLEEGKKRGWVSGVVCQTHDLTPLTPEEDSEFEEGYDPCIQIIRVWDL